MIIEAVILSAVVVAPRPAPIRIAPRPAPTRAVPHSQPSDAPHPMPIIVPPTTNKKCDENKEKCK